jgi:pimeloyl-ACP methyl ester carboxylesterase
MSGALAHQFAAVNEVRLHYVEAGAGPLVILLHGFPEFWYSWRHQIPALVAAGYRVIAPDQRGYNLSAKPRRVGAYRIEELAADVAGLIQHAGESRATVVGHDWGGLVAWHFAMQYPDRVDKLIALNAPHPAAFRRELCRPAQLAKSWYMFFFQLPVLPECVIRARDFAGLAKTLRTDPVRPGAFTDEDIPLYQQALAQPGALTAAINYYRALFCRPLLELRRPYPTITVPTLLIWGERDRYMTPRATENLGSWVPHLRIQRIPDASHWVQQDAPERVNEWMIDFLRGRQF